MTAPRHLTAIAAAALFALPATCFASLTLSHLASDAELYALSPSFDFVAEGRIGDRAGAATFELDLGPDTSAPYTTAQHGWVNAQSEPFTLTYTPGVGSVATFTLGGHTLTYPSTLGANEIFLRTRAVNAGSAITVHSLVLDGVAIADQSQATADGLDILRIQGASLLDGFTLTGTAVLTWTDPAPTQSRLAFQIKVGTVAPTPVEATTWGTMKALYVDRR